MRFHSFKRVKQKTLMHVESLPETFCLLDVVCVYAVARILKSLLMKLNLVLPKCKHMWEPDGERNWKFAK